MKSPQVYIVHASPEHESILHSNILVKCRLFTEVVKVVQHESDKLDPDYLNEILVRVIKQCKFSHIIN